MSLEKYIHIFTELCENLAWNKPADENALYELTQSKDVPKELNRLAEVFGLMLVQVATRDYHKDQLIETLQMQNLALEESKKILFKTNKNFVLSQTEYDKTLTMGQDPEFKKQLDMALTIAQRPINTMILGPTGSGKENIAKTIHYNSSRKNAPFVAINCTAIPESLFESEMFGIEKGIATGVDARKGLIEIANGGTLFLDEIADMSLINQTKLLRVLEEREVSRIGSNKKIPVDFLLLSASHKDFSRLIKEGKFREDLFYRIQVAEINLPSLSERKDDILLLANFFLEKHAKRLVCKKKKLNVKAQKALSLYDWQGNIRELTNEMERATALTVGNTIDFFDLSKKIQKQVLPKMKEIDIKDCEDEQENTLQSMPTNLQDAEIIIIKQVLKECKNNKTKAAQMLGITREGLRKKLQKIEIDI